MPPGRSGEELVTLLARAAQNAGADLMTEARVQDLYADANGRVLGLRILRPGGEVEELGVGALVLATCGFGANHAMVAQYIPEMAGARYFGHEGNRGDGILWGMELGGAVADMSACQGLGTLADPHSIVVPHPLLIEGGYLVNTRGERFTHELENISGMCVPVLQQPGGLAWVIFDDARHLSCLRHSVEQRQLADVGAIKRADSWEGLERACALPRGSLMARAREIDVARNADQADALGRMWRALAPLAPPFCALRVTGALFHTQGGLVVDTGARVLTPSGQPLPNLLAGGGAARGISGADLRGYLPGAGLCMAITLGRLAGRSAARIATHD
jgi:fumarate reductase flavoprotein subunit